MRSGHVGFHEDGGAEDAAVHVALGGQIEDGFDAVLEAETLDQSRVRDVAAHEEVTLVVL